MISLVFRWDRLVVLGKKNINRNQCKIPGSHSLYNGTFSNRVSLKHKYLGKYPHSHTRLSIPQVHKNTCTCIPVIPPPNRRKNYNPIPHTFGDTRVTLYTFALTARPRVVKIVSYYILYPPLRYTVRK